MKGFTLIEFIILLAILLILGLLVYGVMGGNDQWIERESQRCRGSGGVPITAQRMGGSPQVLCAPKGANTLLVPATP